ncbi:hypothetical protein A3A14_00980 [Candidatus Daviesbacteria bacterium RIFCSPLOWO2_01_FULL_43_38]|uniref:Uncharacterized protein n=1 Tax=Candidatus Daviesbacteria bacterium RIFCSPHIGHO2_12_FULL_43_11 TaxID=1797780 RepID=A0A1F5K6N3_9BACT|nr:MAG: hypothetical protein A3E45_01060 [Candidatus Daviesbacteria bacterium RIFCSPHIGHO2_12_FULL_43_11]OGE63539.1 MAG: hypothetical protein A3A14_00980 [Candidatus Daviesbacteria bacterium RIFCSPLOWO2_01_FULL_43_38]
MELYKSRDRKNVKILLVNPPFDYYSRHLLIKEPLSLGYLAAYLRKFGYSVSILDGVAGETTPVGKKWHYGLRNSDISVKIKEFKPDIVGITCSFSLRFDATLNIAKLVKSIDKNIITVVGGTHPTIFPEETTKYKEVDYVIIGEGEESFLQLVKKIESGKNSSRIIVDGCAYKKNGGICLNNKTSFIKNLDTLPFPARDLIPMEFYMNRGTILYGLGKRRAACILTSRSCPGKCTFCSMYLTQGSVFRSRSALSVYEEMEELVKKYHAEEIFILDDNFTFDKGRVITLCKLILRKKLKFRWNTPNGVRADRLDAELLTMMKRAGCVNICIGIEAGNHEIRNEVIKKGLSEEKIYKTLKICSKVGLPVVGFFILGIPGETEETFKDTLKMVKNLPLSMIATSFYTPLPGTQLYNECIQNGYINQNYWKKLNRLNIPIVETPEFNQQTLRRWEKKIYFEFAKSHFWPLVSSAVTLQNEFLKVGLIKRFLTEKFGIHI